MGFGVVKDFVTEALLGEAAQPQRVLLLRALLWAIFIGHMLWATGIWLPGAEAGFVTVHQFNELKDDVKRVEANQLANKIETSQERVCKANLERNKDASNYAARQRNEHMREYLGLTGEPYDVPTCQELGYDVMRGSTIGEDDE